MPSSDYNSIAKVLRVVEHLHPRSILDVGFGNGRYGFLFREILDFNYARFTPEQFFVEIDGIDIEENYIRPHHSTLYNNVYIGDFLTFEFQKHYDLIFLGDVLEHWKEGAWQQALERAQECSDVTLVVCPNHEGSRRQGAWRGYQHETHHSVLSPQRIGGRCLFANSKWFMCGFDNRKIGILDRQDICL